ncbi:MAG: phosphoribosylglycinamide formyltransferase [Clostridiales Family XIII bacterium]|jgi:phosphoribosylglycinamide formyltransferase-1|nr:phosphoribosylglycinamide formyltransferase [Clostridiales Family XIII bacterium]
MTNISVLVSGGGTNLQSVIDAAASGKIPDAKIVLVISSREDAYALKRAEKAGIPTAVVSKDTAGAGAPEHAPATSDTSSELLRLLKGARTDLVLTLGYMTILAPEFIKAYEGRIINIHPSLLPRHGGRGYYGRRVHEAVLAAGDTVSGATVHYVIDDIDKGGIIIQREVPVKEGDDAESLAARVLETEHEIIVEGVNIHLAK